MKKTKMNDIDCVLRHVRDSICEYHLPLPAWPGAGRAWADYWERQKSGNKGSIFML
jgi:hypothetical protein